MIIVIQIHSTDNCTCSYMLSRQSTLVYWCIDTDYDCFIRVSKSMLAMYCQNKYS